ncbi:MAG: ankyrin repeat domain-containing protein, partial [Methanobacteriota archaeon]
MYARGWAACRWVSAYERLHTAVSTGNHAALRAHIACSTVALLTFGERARLLQATIAEDDAYALQALIVASPCVSVDTLLEGGVTLLGAAITLFAVSCTRQLLKLGANWACVDVHGYSAVHLAALHNLHNVLRLLLTHRRCILTLAPPPVWGVAPRIISVGVSPAFLVDTHAGPQGKTPLALAIEHATVRSCPASVSLLLEYGVTVNAPALDGRTPLHRAVQLNSVPTAREMLHVGALVNAQDMRGNIPLHSVAYENQAPCILLLLAHGADAHAANAFGYTPFAYCLTAYLRHYAAAAASDQLPLEPRFTR